MAENVISFGSSLHIRGAFFVGRNWGELVGVGNYWKEADPETAVCRLRKVTACPGRPPLLVNAKTAVRRPPFLVDARWEKDEAGVRQPIEKKGARKLNTCVGKVRSVVGLQTHGKINLSFWVGTRPLTFETKPPRGSPA